MVQASAACCLAKSRLAWVAEPFSVDMQVIKAVQRAIRAVEKQHKKLVQQAEAYLERIGVPAAQGPSPSTARLALEGVQGQLDFVKRLRDTHLAELKAEVAQSDLVCLAAPFNISYSD